MKLFPQHKKYGKEFQIVLGSMIVLTIAFIGLILYQALIILYEHPIYLISIIVIPGGLFVLTIIVNAVGYIANLIWDHFEE